MTIRNMIKVCGAIIAVVLLAGALLAGFKIDRIRMGGPIQTTNQQMSDLVADILPPPAYVLEPYLEATLLIRHPEQVSQRKARLAQLQQDYEKRMVYWHAADLDPEIRTLLTDKAHAFGQAFWADINDQFLPAVARGDMASANNAYEKISRDYTEHRKLIDETVSAASAAQERLKTESAHELNQSILILASLGIALGVILAGAGWLLLARVVKPVVDTADAMDAMAKGNNNIHLEGADQHIGPLLLLRRRLRRRCRVRRGRLCQSRHRRQHAESQSNRLQSARSHMPLHYGLGLKSNVTSLIAPG